MAQASRSDRNGEPRSIAPRVLAPLALAACGLVLFLVISAAISDDGDGGGGEREREAGSERSQDGPVVEGDTYVVEPGDTLTAIAEKTGVSLRRLQALNPDLDPQTLTAGQEIRFR